MVSITAPFKAGRQVLAVRIAGGRLVIWRDGEALGGANVSWSTFAVDRIGYSTSNAPAADKVWRGSIGRIVAVNVSSDTDDHMAIRVAALAVAGFTADETEKWLGARPGRPLPGHSIGRMYYDTTHDAAYLKVSGGWQPLTRPTAGIASYYGVEDGDIVMDLRIDDPARLSLVGDAIRHVPNDGSADQAVSSFASEAPSAVSAPPRAFFGGGGVRLLRLSSAIDIYGKHLLIPVDLPSPFVVGEVKYLIGGRSTFGVRRRSAGQLTVFVSHAGASSVEVSFAHDSDRLVLGARLAEGVMVVSCNGQYMGEIAIPWSYLPVDRIGQSTTNSPSTGTAWTGHLGRIIAINAPSASRDYPAVAECLAALSEVYLPPAPVTSVMRPPYYGSWRNPVVPAWQLPAGWSHPDPAWGLVAGQFDFGRLGMDQSEHVHPCDYANDAIPGVSELGVAELMATGGLCTDAPSPLWCPSELTVDVYGLTPASGVVVAASDTTVRWSLGWTGSGWIVKVAGSTATITDAATVWPADIALVVRDGTAAVYRDGSLVGTAAVAEVPPAATRLSIGGDRVSGTWHPHSVGMVRVTSAARYRGDYAPMRPRSTGVACLGGGAVLGYGAWTWYNDDRAIGAAGKALFGSTTAAALVHSYDPRSGHVRVSKAANWPRRNDHNNPALLTRLDGNQVMICTGHNYGPFVAAATTVPGQVHDLAWRNIAAEIGASDAYYSNIHQLSALPGAPIFQFGRQSFGGTYQIYVARSDDAGATWAHVGGVTAVGPRPYIKTIKSAEDRVDIFTTMTHPEVPNPSLRHLYWDGEVMRDTSGVQISAPGSLTTNLNQATELWSSAADGLNSWTGALHLIGRTLIAWGFVYTGNGGHYLRYSLDLSETEPVWRGEYVCDAGGDLGSNRRYLGGICSHPRDRDRAYASIAHSGRDFQLVELQRGPAGAWSVTRQITDTPTGVRNFRPYPIRDPDMLLWVTGRYASYADYSCGIAALAI